MAMTSVQKKLFELRDEKYAKFQANLTPTLSKESFIGVRVPVLRAFAKEFGKTNDREKFLNALPHKYYDENMLHSILLQEEKDYEEGLRKVNEFLPYVDNWAVCDTLKPKGFKKNKEDLLVQIKKWTKSKKVYTCRFGIEMLMNFFLDEDFEEDQLKIVSCIKSDEYYVNMMIAWYFATALAKQWEASIKVLEENKLSVWVHNKTIQKAIESYRITDEQKEYLRGLRRNDG